MRCLFRNKTPFYYALYQGEADITDEEGNFTGERKVIYSDAVSMKANLSPSKGTSQVEQFGTDIGYDRVIVTDDMNCPIDEHTILWIDTVPTYDEDGNPICDYIVKRVAKSLSSVSIAITRVNTSD